MNRFECREILECAADDLNSNWIGFFISDGNVNARYPSIVKHSQGLHSTIWESRADSNGLLVFIFFCAIGRDLLN